MKKTIYLIRHGQARAGTADYDRLSTLGARQAALLGQYLRETARLPEEVWSGSLRRQRQSAQHFLEACGLNLPIQIEERLNEYDYRSVHHYFHPENTEPGWQQSSDDDDMPVSMSFDTYTDILKRWKQHAVAPHLSDQQANEPLIETWSEFKKRTLTAMLEIANASSASTIALFTSGGVISVIAGQLANHDDGQIPALIWDMNNASLNTISLANGEAQLLGLNDVPHLEREANTTLVTKI